MKNKYYKPGGVFKDPKKPYHPINNPDGYFSAQPTRVDSIALLNNAILKDKFYTNNPDYVKDNTQTDYTSKSFRDRIIREVMSPTMPASILGNIKTTQVNQRLINALANEAAAYGSPLSNSEKKAMEQKKGETRFGQVPGTNLYQFGDIGNNRINVHYNPLAPPIYLHPNISPQGTQAYYSDRFGDYTEVPYYDPIAISPVDMLSDQQLKKRIEKYGKNSVPESAYNRVTRENKDIKPIPAKPINYFTSKQSESYKQPIPQNAAQQLYKGKPYQQKELYIQFKDPKQSTRTSQEIIPFGDWGTYKEFIDALNNAGRIPNTFNMNMAKTKSSTSYGGITKEDAMRIYKKYTTPQSSYRTGGIFKDPPTDPKKAPSPIPKGVNPFATSNYIYKTPNNTTANNPVEYNPVYKNLAEKNFTKQELAAINSKKQDVLKQDRSIPKPVELTPFEQKVLDKEIEAQTLGQKKVTFNQFGEPVLQFDPTMPKASGRVEPDYMDPITMAATFGAGAYGLGYSLPASLGIAADEALLNLPSLSRSLSKPITNRLFRSIETPSVGDVDNILQNHINNIVSNSSFKTQDQAVDFIKKYAKNNNISLDDALNIYSTRGFGFSHSNPIAAAEVLKNDLHLPINKYMYHGTSDARLPQIISSSLDNSLGIPINPGGAMADNLGKGFTTAAGDQKYASTFADLSANTTGGRPVLLRFPNTQKNNLGFIGQHPSVKGTDIEFSFDAGKTWSKQLPSSPSVGDVDNYTIHKAGFPNPLAIADKLIPVPLNPQRIIGASGSWMDLSPLNLIPGYGKKLTVEGELFGYPGEVKRFFNNSMIPKKGIIPNTNINSIVGFRKFGNSIQDVIDRQALSPKGRPGLFGGKSGFIDEGNWAAVGNPDETYKGVFEATMNPKVEGSNIKLETIRRREGVVGTTTEGDVDIPLTDPGLSFNRRLPFSTRYVPIDKQKLINKQFQLATAAPHLQSLLEKYGLYLGGAGALGFLMNAKEGAKKNIKTFNKYTVDPVINWTKNQYENFKKETGIDLESIIGTGIATQQKYKNGGLIKRADGSYSKRGLWDNIRANRGSGKEPTKQMLEQEKKIKAKYQDGGEKEVYWRTGEPMVNDPSMDAISKVLLQRNLNKNFIQRAAGFGYQGGIPTKDIPGQDPNSNDMSTLLMSSADNIVFPTIIQTGPEQLSYEPNQTKEYLEAPSWDVADYFATKGYKRAANNMYNMKYQNGGLFKDFNKSRISTTLFGNKYYNENSPNFGINTNLFKYKNIGDSYNTVNFGPEVYLNADPINSRGNIGLGANIEAFSNQGINADLKAGLMTNYYNNKFKINPYFSAELGPYYKNKVGKGVNRGDQVINPYVVFGTDLYKGTEAKPVLGVGLNYNRTFNKKKNTPSIYGDAQFNLIRENGYLNNLSDYKGYLSAKLGVSGLFNNKHKNNKLKKPNNQENTYMKSEKPKSWLNKYNN